MPNTTVAISIIATILVIATLLFLLYLAFSKLPPLEPFLPLSGSEPTYNPSAWNSDPDQQKRHNCYAYVLDDLVLDRENKPQPGSYSSNIRDTTNMKKYSSCPVMLDRIETDNPSIYKAEEDLPCMAGFYKGYLTLAPGEDYHFYRQDSNGYFSHKRGKLAVEDTDAAQNKIENPRLANRVYGDRDYNESCGYFCIPSNSTSLTSSTS